LWQVRQQGLYESLGKPNPGIVFCTTAGCRINPNHFREWTWHECLKKAGIRYLKFHGLRHTFASLLLQQGESIVYVQDQMGHYSSELTVSVYGHLVPGANRSAVNQLDDT
jgi:integrase